MAGDGQRQALSHPVRAAIFDLYKEDTGRSLAVDALLADLRLRTDLAEQYPSAFRNLDAAKVKYHRARLQDVDLLPAEG
jgi:hypothetical protein